MQARHAPVTRSRICSPITRTASRWPSIGHETASSGHLSAGLRRGCSVASPDSSGCAGPDSGRGVRRVRRLRSTLAGQVQPQRPRRCGAVALERHRRRADQRRFRLAAHACDGRVHARARAAGGVAVAKDHLPARRQRRRLGDVVAQAPAPLPLTIRPGNHPPRRYRRGERGRAPLHAQVRQRWRRQIPGASVASAGDVTRPGNSPSTHSDRKARPAPKPAPTASTGPPAPAKATSARSAVSRSRPGPTHQHGVPARRRRGLRTARARGVSDRFESAPTEAAKVDQGSPGAPSPAAAP